MNGLAIFKEELVVPGIIFIFALLFYTTSLQKECWYRRYILPAMLIALAIASADNFIARVILMFSALLTYQGFRGYGKKILEEKKELGENEGSN